jgi:hypothetical protein
METRKFCFGSGRFCWIWLNDAGARSMNANVVKLDRDAAVIGRADDAKSPAQAKSMFRRAVY